MPTGWPRGLRVLDSRDAGEDGGSHVRRRGHLAQRGQICGQHCGRVKRRPACWALACMLPGGIEVCAGIVSERSRVDETENVHAGHFEVSLEGIEVSSLTRR